MKRTLLLLTCALPLAAQTDETTILRLDNGARIEYHAWYGEALSGANSVNLAAPGSHVVRRTLTNPEGSPWLGFDMHVDKAADNDFFAWFTPAPGFPFFAQAPLPRHLRDGDRVLLDVLEQPGTGKKVFDMFQLRLGDQHRTLMRWFMFGIPSVLPSGTPLRLSHATMRLNGAQARWDQGDAVLAGSQVAIEVPLVGRFSLSSAPQEGYSQDALASGNKIEMALDQMYEVSTDSPVVDRPGAWFLWVKFEPAPHTASLKAEGPSPVAATIDRSDAGAFMSVKNVSGKNILAYTIKLTYGEKVAGSGAHSVFHKTDYLAPGQVDSSPKPINSPPGATLLTIVDLVIFQDGSYWGPVATRAAQQQLQQAQQMGIVK